MLGSTGSQFETSLQFFFTSVAGLTPSGAHPFDTQSHCPNCNLCYWYKINSQDNEIVRVTQEIMHLSMVCPTPNVRHKGGGGGVWDDKEI